MVVTLQDAQLLLLAPKRGKVPHQFTSMVHDTSAYESLIAEVRRLRQDLYACDEPSGEQTQAREQQYLDIDAESWHLMLREPTSHTVVGCIRFAIIDMNRTPDPTEHLLAMTSVQFPDDQTQQTYLQAMDRYFAQRRTTSHQLFYIGGLAVRPAYQNRGIGSLLGLHAAALAKVLNVCHGITVANDENGGADLAQRIGGAPLADHLRQFYCMYHRCQARVLNLSFQYMSDTAYRHITTIATRLRTNEVLIGSH